MLYSCYLNKLNLMVVSRGNILKTTGMLCNPNFIRSRRIGVLVWALYIFPLPTHIFTKDGKTGNAYFHRAEQTLCFSDQVLVLLCLPRSIKGEYLLNCIEEEGWWWREREEEYSKASLTLEIFGDPRTTNTRQR